jgi:hypothetical protein
MDGANVTRITRRFERAASWQSVLDYLGSSEEVHTATQVHHALLPWPNGLCRVPSSPYLHTHTVLASTLITNFSCVMSPPWSCICIFRVGSGDCFAVSRATVSTIKLPKARQQVRVPVWRRWSCFPTHASCLKWRRLRCRSLPANTEKPRGPEGSRVILAAGFSRLPCDNPLQDVSRQLKKAAKWCSYSYFWSASAAPHRQHRVASI